MTKPLTLDETFKMLGIQHDPETFKRMAKSIWSKSTGEPDWIFMRTEVREREDGCPELVISIPFGAHLDAEDEG